MADAFTPRFVDLVRNTTTTIGTGNFVLGAAVQGFSSFAGALAPGESFYYSAIGVERPAEREVGRGTMQANGTISRDPISGTKTNFTSGSKTISLIAAAEWFSQIQATAAAGPGGGAQLTNASVPVSSRAELAALDRAKGLIAHLTEAGCDGLFVFDASNLSAAVAGDPKQAMYVAPTSAPTGSAGAWVRRLSDGAIRPEWFGAKGDGATDDSAALAAASAVINAAGGGVLELRCGATYRVGGQEMRDPPVYTSYTYPPKIIYPIEFANCARGVTVRGNGARIRCIDNARYGVFNPDGTAKAVASGYVGPGASTPYYAMIHVHGCNGVVIEDVELDGNLNALNVNGHFSDTGIQLPATGLLLAGNAGPVAIRNVHSHHHPLDGVQIDGSAEDASDHKESGAVSGGRFECNGRQGMSFVGGKGWSFRDCKFNYTGKANAGSDAAGRVASNPGAGVDLEAEGVKEIRDLVFDNCEFIGNVGCGIVADSGTDVDHVTIRNSTLIGTTNYVLWTNRPGFKFYNCKIHGTWVNLWPGATQEGGCKPQDAVTLVDCFQSNGSAYSPTGNLFTINGLLWEGGQGFVAAHRCTFENWLSPSGGLGNMPTDRGPLFADCNFISRAGGFYPSGMFRGRTFFVEDGGAINGVPGGPSVEPGKNDAGRALDGWVLRTGGADRRYGPTADRAGNKLGIMFTGYDGNWALTPGSDPSTVVHGAPLTQAREWTVPDSASPGTRFRFSRTAASAGAFDWTIKTAGGAALLTLPGPGASGEIEYLNSTYGWLQVAS